MKFYAPMPRSVRNDANTDLIRRLFRSTAEPGMDRIDLITTTQLRVAVVESPAPTIAEGDTAVHVLWQMDEDDASIEIAGERHRIAPGDSAAIPTGDDWVLSSGQLAVVVVRKQSELVIPVAPHHGIERFDGFNRATTYELPDSQQIERWKVTGPLTIPAQSTDRVVIALYNDIALQHQTEIDLVPQGNARVIRAGTGDVTLVPDGLAYVLLLDG